MKLRSQQIEWRRFQVLELSSKGHNQSEISNILQIHKSVISRDISFLKEQSRRQIRKYIDEKLPQEYEKCLVGITAILKEAWSAAEQTSDKREKIQALSLAKDCYSMKLELLTNATVVEDAIRFVSTYYIRISSEKEKIEKSKALVAVRSVEKKTNDIRYLEENDNQQRTEGEHLTTTNGTF